ncbi:hypothetical protein Btru_057108 [Bulinus truncatus]|nr:hypothetical protein Btru_057108 [Bulinus truncatus]
MKSTTGRVLREEYYGKSTAGRVLREEYCGKSTAGRVLREEYYGKSTTGRVLREEYCGKSTAGRVLREEYCGKSTTGRVLREEYCGKSTTRYRLLSYTSLPVEISPQRLAVNRSSLVSTQGKGGDWLSYSEKKFRFREKLFGTVLHSVFFIYVISVKPIVNITEISEAPTSQPQGGEATVSLMSRDFVQKAMNFKSLCESQHILKLTGYSDMFC